MASPSSRIDPIDIYTAIVDPATGIPTDFFIQQWNAQQEVNGEIVIPGDVETPEDGGLEGGGSVEDGLSLSIQDQTLTPAEYGGIGKTLTLTVNQKGIVTEIDETNALAVQQDDALIASAAVLNFEGSVTVTDDGSGKVTVNVTGGGGGGFPGAGSHRYWRIYILNNNGDPDLTVAVGIELRNAGGTNLVGSGTAFASSAAGGLPPSNAFIPWSAPTSNYWSTAIGGGTPSFIGYDFGVGNAEDVKSFTLTGVREVDRMPADFALQSSDDGVNWQIANLYIGSLNWVINGTDTRTYIV